MSSDKVSEVGLLCSESFGFALPASSHSLSLELETACLCERHHFGDVAARLRAPLDLIFYEPRLHVVCCPVASNLIVLHQVFNLLVVLFPLGQLRYAVAVALWLLLAPSTASLTVPPVRFFLARKVDCDGAIAALRRN